MAQIFTISQRYQKYYQRLEPLFKNRQTQAYTMAILSLLTIAFFGVFAIRPTLKTIATLHRQIEDKENLNQKLEDKISALIAAQETYQQIEPSLEKIYSLMPTAVEFPSLIRRLELISVKNSALISGLQIDEVTLYSKDGVKTPAAPTVKEIQQTADATLKAAVPDETAETVTTPTITKNAAQLNITFTISYQGNYLNLANLLNQLTQMDRLVTINSFTLGQPGVGGQTTSSLSLSLNAQAYYLPL